MPEYTVQVGDLFEVTVNAKNPQEANEIAQMQVHAIETLDNTKANKRLAGEPGTNPNFAHNMLNAVKGADKYAQLTGTNDAWRSIGFKDRNDFLNMQGDYDTILRAKGFKTISDTINEGLSEDEAAWKASVRKKQPDAVFSRDTKGNLIATSPTNVVMSADKRNVNRLTAPTNANTKGKKMFDQRKKELQQYAQIDVSNTTFSPMAMNTIRSFVDSRMISGPLPSSMAIQMTNELKTKHPDWNDQELMKAIKFYIANKSKSRIAAPASSEGTRLADHFNKIDLELDSQPDIDVKDNGAKEAVKSAVSGAALGFARNFTFGAGEDRAILWLKKHGWNPNMTSAMGGEAAGILAPGAVVGKLVKGAGKVLAASKIAPAIMKAAEIGNATVGVARGEEKMAFTAKLAREAGLLGEASKNKLAAGAVNAYRAVKGIGAATEARIADINNMPAKKAIGAIYNTAKGVYENRAFAGQAAVTGHNLTREYFRGYQSPDEDKKLPWSDLAGSIAAGFEQGDLYKFVTIAQGDKDPAIRALASEEAQKHADAINAVALNPDIASTLNQPSLLKKLKNPMAIMSLALNSLGSMKRILDVQVGSAAWGSGLGALPARAISAATAGKGSFDIEFGNVFMEEALKHGYDPMKPEDMEVLLNKDHEKEYQSIKNAAARRGVAVGAFDMIAALFGGVAEAKLGHALRINAMSNVTKPSMMKIFMSKMIDFAGEQVLGGLGEAAGQIARAGKLVPINMSEVQNEMIGDPGGLVNIAIGNYADTHDASYAWASTVRGLSTEQQLEQYKRASIAHALSPEDVEFAAAKKGLEKVLTEKALDKKSDVTIQQIKDIETEAENQYNIQKQDIETKKALLLHVEAMAKIGDTPVTSQVIDYRNRIINSMTDAERKELGITATGDVETDSEYEKRLNSVVRQYATMTNKDASDETYKTYVTTEDPDMQIPEGSTVDLIARGQEIVEMRDAAYDGDPAQAGAFDKELDAINVALINQGKGRAFDTEASNIVNDHQVSQYVLTELGGRDEGEATYKDGNKNIDGTLRATDAGVFFHPSDGTDIIPITKEDLGKLTIPDAPAQEVPEFTHNWQESASIQEQVKQVIDSGNPSVRMRLDNGSYTGGDVILQNGIAFFRNTARDSSLTQITADNADRFEYISDGNFTPFVASESVEEPAPTSSATEPQSSLQTAEQAPVEETKPVEEPKQEATVAQPQEAPSPAPAPTKPADTPAVSEPENTAPAPEVMAVDHSGDTIEERPRHRQMNPNDIEVNADVFQFKGNKTPSGTTGSLSGVSMWDENMAGSISVWTDPADGKTYVVNGHNRLAKAKELGVNKVWVFELQAKDAAEATLIGAMQNISEGHGTAIDAAKIFRAARLENKLDEVIAKMGKGLTNQVAKDGIGLSYLASNLFRQVENGSLPQTKLALIGSVVHDEGKQMQIVNALGGEKGLEKYSVDTIVPIVRGLEQTEANARASSDPNLGFGDVFGDDGWGAAFDNSMQTKATIFGKIFAEMKRQLSTLNYTSKEARAEIVAEAGGHINIEQSKANALELQQQLDMFETYGLRTEFADVMNKIMEEYQNAKPSEKSAVLERGQAEVQRRASELFRSKFGGKGNTDVSGTPGMGESLFGSEEGITGGIAEEDAKLIRPEDMHEDDIDELVKSYGATTSPKTMSDTNVEGDISDINASLAANSVKKYEALGEKLKEGHAQYLSDLQSLQSRTLSEQEKQVIAQRVADYRADQTTYNNSRRAYDTAMHATVINAVSTAKAKGIRNGLFNSEQANAVVDELNKIHGGNRFTVRETALPDRYQVCMDEKPVDNAMFKKGTKTTKYGKPDTLYMEFNEGVNNLIGINQKNLAEYLAAHPEEITDGSPIMTVREIVRAFSRAAHLFVYTEDNMDIGFLGMAHLMNRTIALQSDQDLDTWLHEFGHHLIKGDELDGFIDRFNELESADEYSKLQEHDNTTGLNPDDYGSYLKFIVAATGQYADVQTPDAEDISEQEAIAELFRMYTLNPDELMVKLPKAYYIFNSILPDTLKKLSSDIKKQIYILYSAKPSEVSGANVEQKPSEDGTIDSVTRILKAAEDVWGSEYKTSVMDKISFFCYDKWMPSIKALRDKLMSSKGMSLEGANKVIEEYNVLISQLVGARGAAQASMMDVTGDYGLLTEPGSDTRISLADVVKALTNGSLDQEEFNKNLRNFQQWAFPATRVEDAVHKLQALEDAINEFAEAWCEQNNVPFERYALSNRNVDVLDDTTARALLEQISLLDKADVGGVTRIIQNAMDSQGINDGFSLNADGLTDAVKRIFTKSMMDVKHWASPEGVRPITEDYRTLDEFNSDERKDELAVLKRTSAQYTALARAMLYKQYMDGLISLDRYVDTIKARKYYVDTHRADDAINEVEGQYDTAYRGEYKQHNNQALDSLKKRGYSADIYLDPMQSLSKQIEATFVQGAHNKIKQFWGELFLTDSQYGSDVPQGFDRGATEQGNKKATASGALAHEVNGPFSPEEAKSKRIISYKVEGQTKYVQVNSDLVYKSVMNVGDLNAVPLLNSIVQVMRKMITITPSFVLRNMFRDRFGVWRKSKNLSQMPLSMDWWNLVLGRSADGKLLHEKDFQEIKSAGMSQSTYAVKDVMSFNKMQEQVVKDVMADGLKGASKVWFLFKHDAWYNTDPNEKRGKVRLFLKRAVTLASKPVQNYYGFMERMAERSEMSPRVLEYQKAFQRYQRDEEDWAAAEIERQGLNDIIDNSDDQKERDQAFLKMKIINDMAHARTRAYAAHDARALQDFGRVGAALPMINSLVGPFISGRMAGLRADYEAGLKEYKPGMYKVRQRTAIALLENAILHAALAYLWYKDEDRRQKYEGISDAVKDTCLLIPSLKDMLGMNTQGMVSNLPVNDNAKNIINNYMATVDEEGVLAIPIGFGDANVASIGRRLVEIAYASNTKGDENRRLRRTNEILTGWLARVFTADLPIDPRNMGGPADLVDGLVTNYDKYAKKPIIPLFETTKDVYHNGVLLRSGATNASSLSFAIANFIKSPVLDPRQLDYIGQKALGTTAKDIQTFSNLWKPANAKAQAFTVQLQQYLDQQAKGQDNRSQVDALLSKIEAAFGIENAQYPVPGEDAQKTKGSSVGNLDADAYLALVGEKKRETPKTVLFKGTGLFSKEQTFYDAYVTRNIEYARSLSDISSSETAPIFRALALAANTDDRKLRNQLIKIARIGSDQLAMRIRSVNAPPKLRR